jgi:hypothetical protein
VFIGGLAGAAQIVAAAIDLIGNPESNGVILGARVLALAGAITGGLLLILELHTKTAGLFSVRPVAPAFPATQSSLGDFGQHLSSR